MDGRGRVLGSSRADPGFGGAKLLGRTLAQGAAASNALFIFELCEFACYLSATVKVQEQAVYNHADLPLSQVHLGARGLGCCPKTRKKAVLRRNFEKLCIQKN
jgi:hypothetical protein